MTENDNNALKQIARKVIEIDYSSPQFQPTIEDISQIYDSQRGDLSLQLEERTLTQHRLFLSKYGQLVQQIDSIENSFSKIQNVCHDLGGKLKQSENNTKSFFSEIERIVSQSFHTQTQSENQ